MHIENNIVYQLESIADALSDINTSEIPELFDYITEQEFDKIVEVSDLLYDIAHNMDENITIDDADYYIDDDIIFEDYNNKEHIEYNDYDISYMPDYVNGYTVQYNGDDIVFDTIDEAKAFIDGLK